MEKKWLLRLPRDVDDWLTLKAAEETVVRRQRVSKNTLIIELASAAKEEKVSKGTGEPAERGGWHDVKSALEFIYEKIGRKTEMDSPANERLKKRISFNLKMLESYFEDLGQ